MVDHIQSVPVNWLAIHTHSYQLWWISIYKLSDVGISSNLIGLLSLTNGQSPPPGRCIMKQWPGVNSCFAEVTENDILWMQDITIPNDTKKTTKLGIKIFRDKQCFNIQFPHMSSAFCPDCQSPLMPLSLNNNCPSTASFQSPIQVNSTSIELGWLGWDFEMERWKDSCCSRREASAETRKFESRYLS